MGLFLIKLMASFLYNQSAITSLSEFIIAAYGWAGSTSRLFLYIVGESKVSKLSATVFQVHLQWGLQFFSIIVKLDFFKDGPFPASFSLFSSFLLYNWYIIW